MLKSIVKFVAKCVLITMLIVIGLIIVRAFYDFSMAWMKNKPAEIILLAAVVFCSIATILIVSGAKFIEAIVLYLQANRQRKKRRYTRGVEAADEIDFELESSYLIKDFLEAAVSKRDAAIKEESQRKLNEIFRANNLR